MRKTTAIVMNALFAGEAKCAGKATTDGRVVLLHGRKIIEVGGDAYFISDGGYPLSKLTKRYLNAIPGVSVHTVKGIHYANGMKWDGSWFRVQRQG